MKRAVAVLAAICALVFAFSQITRMDQPSDTLVSADVIDAHAEESAASAYQPGFVLASLADDVTLDQALGAFGAEPALAGTTAVSASDAFVKFALPDGLPVEEAITLMTATGVIASAQPNRYYYIYDGEGHKAASLSGGGNDLPPSLVIAAMQSIQSAVNDPSYSQQWALDSINAPAAWDTVGTSNASAPAGSVTVAVLDAGFRTSHEDLAANVAAVYDVTTGRAEIAADNTSRASLNHGTHVAGIVAAQANNGKGIAGITYNNCRVLPVRVEDSDGNITTEYLADAFTYIKDNAALYNIRVANVSLGTGTDNPVTKATDPLLYKAIESARTAGIITVAAACNSDGDYTPPFHAFPSDFDNVVSVINLERASASQALLTGGAVIRESSSNYNKGSQKAKDVSAPGERIYSLLGGSDSSYGNESGTSMAAPVAAATLGLMLTADPGLTTDEAVSKLFSSAHDIGAAGWDAETGYGEVDAAAATSATSPYLSGATHVLTGASLSLEVKVAGIAQPADDWSWSTSDPAIATVSGGFLTGVSAGQVVVTAMRNGQVAAQTVTVDQSSFAVSALNISVPAKTYTGKKLTPDPVVFNGSTRLVSGTHYTAQYANNLNAGTATITITGIAPYYGSVKKTFTIKKAPLSEANITLSATKLAYTGKKVKPAVALADIGSNKSVKLRQGSDYKLTGKGVKIGKGSLTIAATAKCANFTGKVTKTYKVKVKSTPVYSLRNPRTGQWFYTASKPERNSFRSNGWTYKKIAWKAPTKSNHPVYLLSKGGQFRYTKSASQRKKLTAQGWTYNKVAFYSDDFKTRPIYRHANPLRYAKSKSPAKAFYAL